MTEKRFKYSYSLEKVYDCNTFNGETTESYGTFECCDMLNQLNDENEQLKKALVELKEIGDYQEGRIKELSDENDQLKEELEQCKAVIEKQWSEYLKEKELIE